MQTEKMRFILASASPRRKELLTKAGFQFDIVVSNIDEAQLLIKELSPAQFACKAALAKANDVAERFKNRLIVAADTIADFNGKIIGKAEDAGHAEQITRKLFSEPHKIITAIAMVKKDSGLELVEYDTTVVYPRKMSEKQLAEHIASEVWKDKAGAYAIQEGGDEFIDHIEGSETNVMGFSMELFGKMIKKV
ncbi:MAG: septum formation protein Maf [Planctomycetes bacterium]|nr:septum formation protein Maf [Planctomycetota bacterium]MBU1518090.1 septum formation protein Maf [Planctomycetota bacterium]MBU2457792.1 septum formation protein Maf [Planctomycetota bacterium]